MPLRFALLGHPVAHSASPAMHAAALASLGLPHTYEALDCPDRQSVEAAFARLRSGDLAGANVTMPHKQLALELADRADRSAEAVGAANTLVRQPDGSLVAHNTDVPALAHELRALGARPGEALVLGSGGAARAAVAACFLVGATRVHVSSRSWSPGLDRSSWKGARGLEALGAEALAWPASPADLAPLAPRLSMLLQSTSAGVGGDEGSGRELASRLPWADLPRGAVAFDLVYGPGPTPFERAAREAGLPAAGGLGMLAGQGALALGLWLGREAPAEVAAVMLEAARRRLGYGS